MIKVIGLVSSLSIAVLFITYTALYVLILVKYRIPKWKSVDFLASETDKPWFKLFSLCQILTLITGIAYVCMIGCFYMLVNNEYRIFALLSLVFTIMFILLSSEHYFVQLSYVRNNLKTGERHLEQYTQLNPKSYIISYNILGWTLFYGLSCIFISFAFDSSFLGRSMQIVFLLNGVICVLGMFGYTFNKMILNIIHFNGMGLCTILMGLLSFLYFIKM